jgi:hypothetical protein
MLNYRIAPTRSLILDATGYDLGSLCGAPIGPANIIRLVQDRDHRYYAPLLADTPVFTLSPETLIPDPGSAPYEGLASGQQVIVAIGQQDDPKRFNVIWASVIDVE